jgi:hypothetical protein
MIRVEVPLFQSWFTSGICVKLSNLSAATAMS